MAEPAHQPKKTIRQLRQERGWTQQDVAVRMGVASRSVIRWEGEQRRPQRANRQRLADLFGVGSYRSMLVIMPAQDRRTSHWSSAGGAGAYPRRCLGFSRDHVLADRRS